MNYTCLLITLNLFLFLQVAVTVQQVSDGGEPEILRVMPSASLEQSQKQSQGGNFASFNQSCALSGEQGFVCNTYKNMVCDTNDRKCKCKMPASANDPVYVYSDVGNQCYQVATKENLWDCSVNEQCLQSTLGKYSQCLHETKSKCVCVDVDGKNRETNEINGKCYVKKELNSQCETDVECEESIKNSVCFGTKSGPNVGICQCPSKYAYDTWFAECVQLGTINSTCKSDVQCNHADALGDLSVCSSNRRCECWDTKENGKSMTAFYKGACHYVRGVNETCGYREECVLGYDRKAVCETHPSYNNQKVCQCPLNYTCAGSEVTVSMFLMAAIAMFLKSF